jgi:type I restriction enzyme M protein
MEKAASSSRRGSRVGEQSAYRAKGVVYLSPNARFEHLLALAEGEAVGKAVIGAIGVLAKVCNSLTPWTRLTGSSNARNRS